MPGALPDHSDIGPQDSNGELTWKLLLPSQPFTTPAGGEEDQKTKAKVTLEKTAEGDDEVEPSRMKGIGKSRKSFPMLSLVRQLQRQNLEHCDSVSSIDSSEHEIKTEKNRLNLASSCETKVPNENSK
eukprot:g35606.t1